MKIGFTGTRNGMTHEQKQAFASLIYLMTEFHHGDCIGADNDAATLVLGTSKPIIAHPPTKTEFRAFFPSDMFMPEKDYLTRNKDIVNATDLLIAAPASNHEELRSGTWSTIRYARKKKRKVYILWPNGKVILI